MMEDIKIDSTEMSDLEGSSAFSDSSAKYTKKGGSNSVYPDPVADQLLGLYNSLGLANNESLKYAVLASPIASIAVFYVCFSSSTSALISFIAWNFSIIFMLVSFWILCEILLKDQGPRAMQEIAEVIREGSEGFFITQYGTIFKYAFMTALGLFVMYAMREIPAQSNLNNYFSPLSMAVITSISFLMGSICSAIAGYSGIWVSVRANLRVAAASRKCYNDAIQICFRGGAFAAIINVALAIFGISSLYLAFIFYFYMIGAENPPIEEIPALIVGFGFGASFVAMFA